jgi:hypothetical protein
MKKRILMVHGWKSSSMEHFFPEEKTRLEKLGYDVLIPDMPSAFHPIKDEWIKVIRDFDPDENSILIGHSLGGTAIIKFLEVANKTISKCILLATPIKEIKDVECDSTPILNFFEPEIDWQKVRKNCNKFIIINQDQDPYGPVEHGRDLARLTGGELRVVEGNNHFDTIDLPLLEQYILT